ncbi:MAG: GNAT family N-acetyltransferase [Erysipelotrichaceae bacterium]
MNNIFILTDGGKGVGNGHITRCSTIFKATKNCYANTCMWVKGEALPQQEHAPFWQAIDYETCLADFHQDLLFVDSYRIREQDIALLARNNRVILLDDFGQCNEHASLVFNPAPFLKNPPSAQQYHYGSEFVLLREAFLAPSKEGKRETILITMGGSDNLALSATVVDMMKTWAQSMPIHLVVGSAFPHKEALIAAYQDDVRVRVCFDLDASQMRMEMEQAAICISACGQTIYELLKTHTPFVAIQTIDNQSNNRGYLEALGYVVLEGNAFHKDALFEAISHNLSQPTTVEIDGEGASRIASMLVHGFYQRQMNAMDCKAVYELSNQPYVRAYSLNKEPIPWAQHCNWFETMLQDPNWLKRTLVGEKHEFLGQVRLKMQSEHEGVISISFSSMLKGKGKGAIILQTCIASFFKEKPALQRILAYVESENIASQKIFMRSGFQNVEKRDNILLYELQKGENGYE